MKTLDLEQIINKISLSDIQTYVYKKWALKLAENPQTSVQMFETKQIIENDVNKLVKHFMKLGYKILGDR